MTKSMAFAGRPIQWPLQEKQLSMAFAGKTDYKWFLQEKLSMAFAGKTNYQWPLQEKTKYERSLQEKPTTKGFCSKNQSLIF